MEVKNGRVEYEHWFGPTRPDVSRKFVMRFYAPPNLVNQSSVFATDGNKKYIAHLGRLAGSSKDKNSILADKTFSDKVEKVECNGRQHDMVIISALDESLIQNIGQFVAKLYSRYTLKNILQEGCFVKESELEKMAKQLDRKMNLILQGPPGTGKTWLAKKLAFALIGSEDESHLLHIQFHSNWSYADFVRGYRPNREGKLEPVDGPFFEFAKKAKKDKDGKYVCVIEEINRGNLSSIFGEFLTLLEKDKRGIELPSTTHSDTDAPKEKIFLPKNLYVIGTMNLADKSLTTIDVALRRRFAFANLEPAFNDAWKKHCHDKGIKDDNFLNKLAKKIGELNDKIRKDPDLGDQYCIGHSFFTPHETVSKHLDWYNDIVEFEAEPLLEEYLFDRVRGTDTDKLDLKSAKEHLKI